MFAPIAMFPGCVLVALLHIYVTGENSHQSGGLNQARFLVQKSEQVAVLQYPDLDQDLASSNSEIKPKSDDSVLRARPLNPL